MKKLVSFVKDWMLVISMTCGVLAYLIYHNVPSPALHSLGPALESFCHFVQPMLLFLMLFLNFSKVEPRQMKPRRWHLYGVLIQSVLFIAPVLLIVLAAKSGGAFAAWVLDNRIVLEAAMLCFVCPTATAAGVVTDKLGGNIADVVTYTVIVNMAVAVEIPAMIPLIYPSAGISFGMMFSRILAKVFPLLIMPCILAWVVRYLMPSFHKWVVVHAGASFYIWAFSLCMAIAVSTRYIVTSGATPRLLAEMFAVSAAACVLQFHLGKKIGTPCGCRMTAGQSLGQKNTVFSIWMGYTFLEPVTSVVGGFYSICHNAYNSWQLYRHNKESNN